MEPIAISRQLSDRLQSARSVVVLTGAGMSAESGVPTFRDAQTGIWAQFDPAELATPEAFERHPERVWNWYAQRREMVSRAQPNAGHHALAEMEKWFPKFLLVTQNIDNLHQLAGSHDVIELHGNLKRDRCHENRHFSTPDPNDQRTPPLCPECGGRMRPDVVWFGEALPSESLEKAMAASQSCDVFLCVGTSGLVYPAAGLPIMAQESGACLVEINPDATSLSVMADHWLAGPSGVVLPQLMTSLRQE